MKRYLEGEGSDAEHRSFECSCHSVAEAVAAVDGDPDDFVKNICMVSTEGELIVAIVKGEDRASTSRVAKALGIERPRTATPEEILDMTGFPCGGTPSFGFEATFLVDPRVPERDEVWTGGGSQTSLVHIRTEEMLRLNDGKVVRVRK